MSSTTITAPNMYSAPQSQTANSAYYSTATTASSTFWGTGSSGNWTVPSSSGVMWSSIPSSSGNMWSATVNNSSFTCATDAEFEGDIRWRGRSLGKLLEKIEDRLAILQEPNAEKLEKFAALKKAYDHYKLIEKLVENEE